MQLLLLIVDGLSLVFINLLGPETVEHGRVQRRPNKKAAPWHMVTAPGLHELHRIITHTNVSTKATPFGCLHVLPGPDHDSAGRWCHILPSETTLSASFCTDDLTSTSSLLHSDVYPQTFLIYLPVVPLVRCQTRLYTRAIRASTSNDKE